MSSVDPLFGVARPERGPDCPPIAVLDAHVAGEAVGAEQRAHVDSCPRCHPYVMTLQQEQEQFRKQRPADLFIKKLERRASQTRAWSSTRDGLFRLVLGFSGVVAAMAVAVVFLRPTDSIRLKGGAFRVFYKREGMPKAQPVVADQHLEPGDTLRFAFSAPGDGYLAILDLDETRNVTVFYPYGKAEPAPILAHPTEPLEHSITLDQTPGSELLVAVFKASSFELEPLIRQMRGQSPSLPLKLECSGCQVETLRIHKGP